MVEILAVLVQNWYVIVPLLLIVGIVSIWGNMRIDWHRRIFSFGSKKGRSCTDCVMLMHQKRVIFEATYNNLISCILRDQMNFVEQKLQELEAALGAKLKPIVKDTIRTTMKENRFDKLNHEEFAKYLEIKQDKFTHLIENDSKETHECIKEIYEFARETKIRIDSELKLLEQSFIDDINKLVGI